MGFAAPWAQAGVCEVNESPALRAGLYLILY